MREIYLAKSSGFCYGVKRAVDKVYEVIENEKVTTLGPIIHNKIVTSDLKQKGASCIEKLDDYQNGNLIIRTHGVTKKIYEELENKKISYVDCTCFDVKKIHKIVENDSNNGLNIIIIGSEKHPEVIGTMGWSKTEVVVIDSELDEKIKQLDKNIKYSIVVQTTFTNSGLKKIIKKLEEEKINFKLNNTICSSTEKRQSEAISISKKVDYMIVLGDKKSSNANKLYELCKKNCLKTFFIETITDLELKFKNISGKIGITASASTPQAIIKEAMYIMNEEKKNEVPFEENFEEMLEKSLETKIRSREIVKGTVIRVSGEEVFVNIQSKSDGIIPFGEFSKNPDLKPADVLKPDDEIEVYVLTLNDGEGNILLSRKRIENQKSLAEIEEVYNNKGVIKGKVVDLVKGGLIALIKDVRIFVPASQISSTYVRNLEKFLNKEFDFNIIEFNKSKRKIVAGRKDLAIVEEQKRKEEIYSNFEVGKVVKGIVRRIVEYGAFVDIGGIDGLIHISELAWSRVSKVTDVINVNDEIEVAIIDIDKENDKIALSLKSILQNPWANAEEKYAVGNIVEGRVVRIVEFGAFVEIEPGVDALLHISQISSEHTEKVEDALRVTEEIKAKIIELDVENKKVSISIKKLEENIEE